MFDFLLLGGLVMAGTLFDCGGSCTWEFIGGVWVARNNCDAGCNCTGPLPVAAPGGTPSHGVNASGQVFMTDALFRSTFNSPTPPPTPLPPAAAGSKVTLP